MVASFTRASWNVGTPYLRAVQSSVELSCPDETGGGDSQTASQVSPALTVAFREQPSTANTAVQRDQLRSHGLCSGGGCNRTPNEKGSTCDIHVPERKGRAAITMEASIMIRSKRFLKEGLEGIRSGVLCDLVQSRWLMLISFPFCLTLYLCSR